MKQFGIGVGYRNPHDYDGADVEQQYLPDKLVGPALLRALGPGLGGPHPGADGRAHGGSQEGAEYQLEEGRAGSGSYWSRSWR